jgi:hypothetical protein
LWSVSILNEEHNMAVMSQYNWRVAPGHLQGVLKIFGESRAIHQRLGAAVSVGSVVHGGEHSNTLMYTLQYETSQQAGDALDASAADPEWAAKMAEWTSRNTGLTLMRSLMAFDVPGFERALPDGSQRQMCMASFAYTPTPDQIAGFVYLAAQVKPFYARHGLDMRLVRGFFNGAPPRFSAILYGEPGKGLGPLLESLSASQQDPDIANVQAAMAALGSDSVASMLVRSIAV